MEPPAGQAGAGREADPTTPASTLGAVDDGAYFSAISTKLAELPDSTAVESELKVSGAAGGLGSGNNSLRVYILILHLQ